jgi:molecular chaperone DnaK
VSTHLGIDLGTTNSAAALASGGEVTPLRTVDGGTLLPSVVRIDARGNVTVGARARKFLDSDPENTRAEFKRLMGADKRLAFRAAKADKSPEELSALVLGALRTAAEHALGHAPVAAVIAVPALFELPQIRATSEAARLAGFERVEHLQEPVASALRAGWNRDDLGGGTFDVSLVETREGVLRVIDHDGDNFLGGRDMDARLLDCVLERLSESTGRPLKRSNPALGVVVRRIRAACEEAKLDLGAGRDTSVTLPDALVVEGEEIVVDIPVEAREFEAMITPIVDRTLDVCARLLARQGFEPASIGRIVLVGGPTVMESLRNRIGARLGIPLAADVDPMTAVAEGAALFAAERALGTSAVTTAAPTTPHAEKVWVQYPAVSGDLHPYLVGRFSNGSMARFVRVERSGFTSTEERVGDDGAFVVQLSLETRAASTFEILAFDEARARIEIDPHEVTIRHGLSLADPPLSRTIGVALANGNVAVYFERGAPLPSRKTFRLRTALTVHPNQEASAISVPIVQGEVDLAHLCRLVGTIEIRPKDLRSVLPAGSAIDVVLELDRGGKLSATAQIPDRNVSFPGTLVLVAPDAPLDALEAQLAQLRTKTEELYADALVTEAARKKLIEIDGTLDEVMREVEAARGGDSDAVEKLRRLLIDTDAALADVEASRTWPELEQQALDVTSWAMHWVSKTGSEMDRRTLDEAIRSLGRARATRSAADVLKRIRAIDRLGSAACMRDHGVVRGWFGDLSARVAEMRDPHAAKQLVAKGNEALARGDIDEVRRTAHALHDLLPPEEEIRAKAHGSGVER